MRGRALIIATSKYSDASLSALPSTEIDAHGLRQILGDSRIGDFDVTSSLNATCQSWREQIEALFSDAGHNESLLLYISGHGIKDKDGRLYFAASDTRLKNLLSTGVSSTFIQEVSNTSRSSRISMILDTCFSGAFAKGVQLKSGGRTLHAADYFQEGTGKVVITASDALQYAIAGDSIDGDTSVNPSVFSRYLIEGLRTGEADSDGDGQVTTEDLYRYISSAMHRDGVQQRPLRWSIGLSHDFVIATNPAPKPGKVPEDIDELISHWRPEVRLVAIQKLAEMLKSGRVQLVLAAQQALERLIEDDSRIVASAAATAIENKTQTVNVFEPREPSGATPPTPPSLEAAIEAQSLQFAISKSDAKQTRPDAAGVARSAFFPKITWTPGTNRKIWIGSFWIISILVVFYFVFFYGRRIEHTSFPATVPNAEPAGAAPAADAGKTSTSKATTVDFAAAYRLKPSEAAPVAHASSNSPAHASKGSNAQEQQTSLEGQPVAGFPHVVYNAEGGKDPAVGYEWVNPKDPGDLRVQVMPKSMPPAVFRYPEKDVADALRRSGGTIEGDPVPGMPYMMYGGEPQTDGHVQILPIPHGPTPLKVEFPVAGFPKGKLRSDGFVVGAKVPGANYLVYGMETNTYAPAPGYHWVDASDARNFSASGAPVAAPGSLR